MYNLNFSNFTDKVDIIDFVRHELVPTLENDQFIDWDVIPTETLEGLMVDFLTNDDCSDNLHNAIFMQADGAEMANLIMRFAFSDSIEDALGAKKALHNALVDHLIDYCEKLANSKLGVW